MDHDRRFSRGRALIHWGSVFAGAVWALATTVLLSALWLALGFGSGLDAIRDNIEWFLAGSAMLAMLLGGFVAGWLPGVRGWGPGLVNGMSVWGLMLTVSLLIGVPSVVGGAAALLDNAGLGGQTTGATDAATGGGQALATGLWAGFWTALIGLGLAALGGVLGGATPHEGRMYETLDRDEDRRRMAVVERDEDVTVRRTGTQL